MAYQNVEAMFEYEAPTERRQKSVVPVLLALIGVAATTFAVSTSMAPTSLASATLVELHAYVDSM